MPAADVTCVFTNVEQGKEIINSSGLNVIAADNLKDGAEKIEDTKDQRGDQASPQACYTADDAQQDAPEKKEHNSGFQIYGMHRRIISDIGVDAGHNLHAADKYSVQMISL